jgi:hypothetical protein
VDVLGRATNSLKDFFAPFRNASIYPLMPVDLFYGPSTNKSIKELIDLVKNVVLAPNFEVENFIGFDAAKEHRIINLDWIKNPLVSLSTINRGKYIYLFRANGNEHIFEGHAPRFPIEFYSRKPLDLIKAAFCEPEAQNFHMIPFKTYWKLDPNQPEGRIYGENFTGDVYNAEYNNICDLVRQENCHLEPKVVMSDSAPLAQFGTAELWPIRVMAYLLVYQNTQEPGHYHLPLIISHICKVI